MAPSTRTRSADNTPVKGHGAVVSELDILATPTRKIPHCSKCNRPRAGHPRSGCPFVTPTKENVSDRSNTNLTDALGSMTIEGQETAPPETPARRKKRRRSEKAAALAPSQTLQSLTDSDLEALLLPGDGDATDDGNDGDTGDEERKIVHWKDRVEMLSAGGTITTRAIMPGTLVTPSPWSSFASIPEDNKAGIIDTDSTSTASFSSSSTETISVEVVSPSSTTVPRPLARTMSMEERAGFMAHLEELSSAKAYVLNRADLAELRQRTPTGLYMRYLMDEDAGRNVLVVGRDEVDTERLFQTLDAEKQRAKYAKQGVDMKSAAGGAVVGAVATFTGLAFS
ncbi:hypothetical protein J3R30DRAFT_3288900 [Lentinula aciculospora]|uniref:Uncharacterized protein n=1 Tax=Lentinula aciculospora TaxID=153920 RepID=A0A9W9DNG0_9AGAR|nr:hypothetical protein J3R30DRAFT_3288900 [Lentinula aciculospora]